MSSVSPAEGARDCPGARRQPPAALRPADNRRSGVALLLEPLGKNEVEKEVNETFPGRVAHGRRVLRQHLQHHQACLPRFHRALPGVAGRSGCQRWVPRDGHHLDPHAPRAHAHRATASSPARSTSCSRRSHRPGERPRQEDDAPPREELQQEHALLVARPHQGGHDEGTAAENCALCSDQERMGGRKGRPTSGPLLPQPGWGQRPDPSQAVAACPRRLTRSSPTEPRGGANHDMLTCPYSYP